ncbi:hypothetical protein EEQ63_07640 [Escherichia coli]|nr:hypothetical protein [Escherichia coli]EEW3748593.1 hypothetical protein [Escherichia coli]
MTFSYFIFIDTPKSTPNKFSLIPNQAKIDYLALFFFEPQPHRQAMMKGWWMPKDNHQRNAFF